MMAIEPNQDRRAGLAFILIFAVVLPGALILVLTALLPDAFKAVGTVGTVSTNQVRVSAVLPENSFIAMQEVVGVKNGEHSLKKHKEDALEIHRCLDKNGPEEVWKSRSWRENKTFFQVCKLEDGRWGFRKIWKTRNGWYEKTSFVPKSGTYFDVNEYLSARATKWGGKLSNVR